MQQFRILSNEAWENVFNGLNEFWWQLTAQRYHKLICKHVIMTSIHNSAAKQIICWKEHWNHIYNQLENMSYSNSNFYNTICVIKASTSCFASFVSLLVCPRISAFVGDNDQP